MGWKVSGWRAACSDNEKHACTTKGNALAQPVIKCTMKRQQLLIAVDMSPAEKLTAGACLQLDVQLAVPLAEVAGSNLQHLAHDPVLPSTLPPNHGVYHPRVLQAWRPTQQPAQT